jgi:hypothetical protein
MLKEFSAWLCTQVAGLIEGGNLQFGFRAQDAPVRCHALLDSGGPADFDLPYRRDMMLQVATRGETIVQAREDAWTIYNAIHGTSGWTIGPLVSGGQQYKIWSIGALAKPQYIGIGEKSGFEYSTNYLIIVSPI